MWLKEWDVSDIIQVEANLSVKPLRDRQRSPARGDTSISVSLLIKAELDNGVEICSDDGLPDAGPGGWASSHRQLRGPQASSCGVCIHMYHITRGEADGNEYRWPSNNAQGLGAWTLCRMKNLRITLQSALPVLSSISAHSTKHGWCSIVVYISGPAQFKPALFSLYRQACSLAPWKRREWRARAGPGILEEDPTSWKPQERRLLS